MFEDLSFIGLIQKGGITIIVLALLSIASIAIMLERAWAFRKFNAALKASADSICGVLKGNGMDAAIKLCQSQPTPLSNIFLSGCAKSAKGKDEVLRAMELAGRAEVSRLEARLGALGTIGSTAPFIGLFGTVLGIIRAFSDMAVASGASASAVADGIAEALVATAAGLFVAVPAVMAYNYFVRSVGRSALELERAAAELTGYFGE